MTGRSNCGETQAAKMIMVMFNTTEDTAGTAKRSKLFSTPPARAAHETNKR
jgi:hypothetical protein